MQNFITLFLLSFISLFSAQAQKPDFNAPIADSLKLNANAVVRFSHTTYERTAVDKYKETFHCAITILNSKGSYASTISVYYDNNSKITDIWAIGYNNKGLRVKELKKKDFNDYAAYDGSSMFTDARVVNASWEMPTYPYTIEYYYTIEKNGVLGFSGWNPVTGYNLSVENASLTFKTIPDLSYRIKLPKNSYEFIETNEQKYNVKTWRAKNLKAELPEELSDNPSYILLAPNKISYEGIEGDFSSWNSIGAWSNTLIRNRDFLPPATVEKIKQLTANLPNEKEKIKAVYQYMQNKTRYVNVALGIGGWQPMTATDVDQKGYGDCKALSNYTKALLKSIGIESFYTVIGNGSKEITFPDFASMNQTNHIIVCVPLVTDTVWLECTNQKIPFGYIGAGNSDRLALLIKPEGGVLAKTPTYKAELNTCFSTANYDLNSDGSIKFNFTSEYNNILFEEVFGLIYASPKDQKEFLLRNIGLPTPTIDQFAIADESGETAKGTVKISGNAPNYSTKMGKRTLVPIELILQNTEFSSISDKRTKDIVRRTGFSVTDQVIIKLPANVSIEYLPKPTSLNSAYGKYTISYQVSEQTILVERKMEYLAGRFKKESFAEINTFLKGVTKADKEKIVLTDI